VGGKAKAQERGKGLAVVSCHYRQVFFLEFTYEFRLSVSIREVASEYLFYVLIYIKSCID